MPRRGYSKHVPDFRYITFFAEGGDSFLHGANPWTKLATLATVVSLVTVIMDTLALVILLALTLALYAAARLPLRLLIGWWTLPLFFVFSLSVLFIFTEPGSEVTGFSIGDMKVVITDNGILLTVDLLLKALSVVTCSLAVFMTTRYNHVVVLAYKVMPKTLATIFLLSYRFTFETSDEFSDLLDAIHSRSGGVAKGVVRQSKTYAGIFGHSFVHAFERAERISKAMEARGFTGDLPVSEKLPRPTAKGYFVMLAGIAAIAVAVYSRYFDTNLIGW